MGTVLDEVSLCERRVAAATGWPELPDPPPATAFPGPDGRWHKMQPRLWLAASGGVAEAQESNLSPGEVRPVDVMADHDANVDSLLAASPEWVAHEISRLHLRPAVDHQGWTLTAGDVAGPLVHDRRADPPYALVIDGHRLSWHELGRA